MIDILIHFAQEADCDRHFSTFSYYNYFIILRLDWFIALKHFKMFEFRLHMFSLYM